MDKFFSIIIPTLNEELFLPNLLKNLREQKEKNFEVIIVDGQSHDATKKIVLEHAKSLPFTFLEVEKKNVSYQRNFGASQAKGRYLIFLDADATVNKTFTKIAQKQIQHHKGLIFLPYILPKEKNEYPEINIIFPLLNSLIELSQNFDRSFSAGGCMIWERQFFHLTQGFDEDILAEDHSIIRKAHQWGVKAKVIPSLKIIFSLRRMKKEGRLKLFYKFLISHFYLLFNKQIDKKMFDYDMGGHLYDKESFKINSKKKLFRGVLAEAGTDKTVSRRL